MTDKGLMRFYFHPEGYLKGVMAKRNESKLWHVPFNSQRKKEIACNKLDDIYRITIKGAPEVIFPIAKY